VSFSHSTHNPTPDKIRFCLQPQHLSRRKPTRQKPDKNRRRGPKVLSGYCRVPFRRGNHCGCGGEAFLSGVGWSYLAKIVGYAL